MQTEPSCHLLLPEIYIQYYHAGVTQLVEFLPSKQVVAGSSPVSRSTGKVAVCAHQLSFWSQPGLSFCRALKVYLKQGYDITDGTEAISGYQAKERLAAFRF